MSDTIQAIKEQMLHQQVLLEERLILNIGQCVIFIQSNSQQLLDNLQRYFQQCQVLVDLQELNIEQFEQIHITAIEREVLDLKLAFKAWPREAGKAGRKDEYADLRDAEATEVNARVIRKVKTGMLFLQSESERIVAGPCIANDNQLINYIGSQYMNFLQQHDWLICHASALVNKQSEQGRGLAFAGLSGGGKSTLMLKLLEKNKLAFVSNDRLFIKKQTQAQQMLGIPKLPRINPGTIVGSADLHHLLPPQQLSDYQQMTAEELWHIEQKHDVPLADIYGDESICLQANLYAFIILNWQRHTEKKTLLTEVDVQKRQDLLPAIMKSSGPFYQDLDGHFEYGIDTLNKQDYLSSLQGVKVFEATGQVDFDKMRELCEEIILC